MSSFQDKVYAITGGASGIGLATVRLLVSRGAKVSIADVQDDLLKKVSDEVTAAGGDILVRHVDVRRRHQVDGWIAETVQKFGRLDGAANLAGVIPKSHNVARIEEQSDEEWEYVFAVNVTGVMSCMRAEIPHLQAGGSIVNAGSALSLQGRGGAAAYAASKHAVVGLTSSVAKEVGKRGIRVTCIAPYVCSE